ncbi:MAG: hypothetical protein HY898_11850 [Deltaproteobacteria bacterium]|nr:hypothetical protein [Deltaproteobacteria bacterium]
MNPNTLHRIIVALALGVAVEAAASEASAITRCEVLEDAQSWVDAHVMYCQGPYGSYCTSGCDPCYYDPLRGGECWRPDCSGFVSATWWLSYAMNTTGLCNYAIHIGWDDLEPGDAVVACSQHAILFASWADSSHSNFHAYETGQCGTAAHHSTRNRWTLEGEYTPLRRPGIENCCNAGEVEQQDCGNCGKHHRTCSGDGHWGGWSACEGQGPCSPGETDTQDCCDCGSHTRTCSGSCKWQDWGACGGPDPNGGKTECDTGEPGPCASGKQRCVQGCKKCVRDYEPKPETCDDVDNDCSGVVDDGNPAQMGNPPPKYAAELKDISTPMSLLPGETGSAWAGFINRGTSAWKRDDVWLTTETAAKGKPSPLYDSTTWAAWDVAATLANDVLPGEIAYFRWDVRMPDDATKAVSDTFVLKVPSSGLIRCPVPDVALNVRMHSDGEDNAGAQPGEAQANGGCSASTSTPLGSAWFAMAGLAVGMIMRRTNRRRRSSRSALSPASPMSSESGSEGPACAETSPDQRVALRILGTRYSPTSSRNSAKPLR